jgi:hypothetical protein
MSPPLRDQLDSYARSDLDGGLEAHIAFFDFLQSDEPPLNPKSPIDLSDHNSKKLRGALDG